VAFASGSIIGQVDKDTLAQLLGRTLTFSFDQFTARVSLRADNTLSVEIVEGENNGFTDEARYEVHAVREDVTVLSWQENIGTTVTHVIDLSARRTYATIAPASGGFFRLIGTVHSS
jgi:hypothetical protein